MPEIIIAISMLITVGSIMLAGLAIVYARDINRRINILAEQIESIDDFLDIVAVEAEAIERQIRRSAQDAQYAQFNVEAGVRSH